MIFSEYYQVSLEGYQTICVGYFSFAKGQQAFYRKYKPVTITQHKEHLLIWNSETTPNLNIYFHTTKQKQLAIFPFSSYKASRQSMKKQLWHTVIKIFPYRKYIKTVKNGGFGEELLLVKMTLRLF